MRVEKVVMAVKLWIVPFCKSHVRSIRFDACHHATSTLLLLLQPRQGEAWRWALRDTQGKTVKRPAWLDGGHF
jgi:hypothetical protein